ICADDCAGVIVDTLLAVHAREPVGGVKIIASEEPTPLSRVIRLAATVTHRNPLIVCAHDRRRALQPAALRFRSTMFPHVSVRPKTPLLVGMLRVYSYLFSLFCQGHLGGTKQVHDRDGPASRDQSQQSKTA